MKNLFVIALSLLAFTSCQKQNKIGFVDNGVIINKYKEKLDLENKFEKKKEAFQKKFDSIDASFKTEVQDFQTNARKMSQVNAQKKYQELGQKKQMQDQQKQMEAQNFQQSFQTELDTIIQKVRRYEKAYGKRHGYTFVLGTTDATSTVLYGDEQYDLTQTILDSLNADYGSK
ncbi:OmpH family outer membrane protein [Gaetbulibacter aestuarii]|uniref:OmpH family outer membrane protein n=1 Tax=Gaetbulibacter aestuarii TaxID=1502358 RepID=A0ABW7MUV4_9FLAO